MAGTEFRHRIHTRSISMALINDPCDTPLDRYSNTKFDYFFDNPFLNKSNSSTPLNGLHQGDILDIRGSKISLNSICSPICSFCCRSSPYSEETISFY